jgi:hypothetical protein
MKTPNLGDTDDLSYQSLQNGITEVKFRFDLKPYLIMEMTFL